MVDWRRLLREIAIACRWIAVLVGYGFLVLMTASKVLSPAAPDEAFPNVAVGQSEVLSEEAIRQRLTELRYELMSRARRRDEPPRERLPVPQLQIPGPPSMAWHAMDSSRFGLSFAWLALLTFLPTLTSDRRERHALADGEESFTANALFLRYGREQSRASFAIGYPEPMRTAERSLGLAEDIRLHLAVRMRRTLPPEFLVTDLKVTKLDTAKAKSFLKVLTHTERGSLVAHFVHVEPLGSTLTAHYFSFSRGIRSPILLMLFLLESPLRFWFWYPRWKLGRFSVQNAISSFDLDPFDLIELQTRYKMLTRVLWAETEAVLKGLGLLTTEVEQMIVNNFHSAQQVNIGSPDARLYSVANSPGSLITQIGSIEGGGTSRVA